MDIRKEVDCESDKMGDCPDYYTNISLILSRVMNDVGVNEESVLKRRRTNLMTENISTLSSKMCQIGITTYIFGSQTEGTTTLDLNSDTDILYSNEYLNLIQDWKDWKHDKTNLLMLRDETLYPGHCKLQKLYDDVPLPVSRNDCPGGESFCVDSDGNAILKEIEGWFPRSQRHGPADTRRNGLIEVDNVPALQCQTWPLHYKQWTPTNKRKDWPTPETIRHMKSTGCFVVKAAHRLDNRNETWRISTSLAERCLMFSLNITQIRCYVLLKMVVKTFIQPNLADTISSYMCKTLMFHVIENTKKEIWKEHNLLRCLHLALLYILAGVLDENCPNYFNESANLFLGKVDRRNKKTLMSILRMLLISRGRFLLYISLDNISPRLTTYVSDINYVIPQEEVMTLKSRQCERIVHFFLDYFSLFQMEIRTSFNVDKMHEAVSRIGKTSEKGQLQKKAVQICLPFLCSFLATVDASKSLLQNTQTNPTALKLFDLSLQSDVTSSRLKFASHLYCTGQKERTLSLLKDVEESLTNSVMMNCVCHEGKYVPRFLECEANMKYPTTDRLAVCVTFSMAESQCCPRELQYELFKSTDEEKRNRDEDETDSMNLVVMDSLPFLYFLKYMTLKHLSQHDQQCTALNKLSDCVRNNEYLTHRETAYNVLGQCMEYEGWLDDAIECYRRSAIIRPSNNAVRWHIMRWIDRVRGDAFEPSRTYLRIIPNNNVVRWHSMRWIGRFRRRLV